MKTDLPITLVTSSLGAGGAERVLTMLAGGWVSKGKTVEIFTLEDGVSFYPLPDAVRVLPMVLSGRSGSFICAFWNNLSRLYRMRCFLRKVKSGVIVSFGTETNILVLLSTLGLRMNIIVSERCDPEHYPRKHVWKLLRRVTYPLAADLVVQTTAAKKYFHFISPKRLQVIPNPVLVPKVSDQKLAIQTPYVLAAGRLVPQKGFDILLKAFAQITRLFPEWSLIIAGEGEDRARLERQAAELGVEEKVLMPGVVDNLGDYMASAEMFVLSSRYEGFPNVLTEAMASGLPVVAADCPSGPSDIVKDGDSGFLVRAEDPEALAKGISTLMSNPDLRAEMGRAARRVTEAFLISHVTEAWEKVLEDSARKVT